MIIALFVAAIPRRRIVRNLHDRLAFLSPLLLFLALPDLFDDPGLQHRPLLSSLVAVTSSLSPSESTRQGFRPKLRGRIDATGHLTCPG